LHCSTQINTCAIARTGDGLPNSASNCTKHGVANNRIYRNPIDTVNTSDTGSANAASDTQRHSHRNALSFAQDFIGR
jgi:hypothetical protein